MNKISFIPLTKENTNTISASLAGENESIAVIIESIKQEFSELADNEDIECALSLAGGCLAVRIFDMGRYFFPFPFELDESSDISCAVKSIVYYCMKEEIPTVFTDVPPECISLLAGIGYKHIDIQREGTAGEDVTYRASLINECMELDNIPEISGDELILSGLEPCDIPDYARICRDESAIALWGYDYREDMPYALDSDFFNTAKSELERGVALSIGVRLKSVHQADTQRKASSKLIGEVIFYAFDAIGGADFAFRLLPEYRGRGLGGELVSLIFDYARKIGLDALMADVMRENAVSCRLLNKYMELLKEEREKRRYIIEL